MTKHEHEWLEHLEQICVERYGLDAEDFVDIQRDWRADNTANWKEALLLNAERCYDASMTPADAARYMESIGVLNSD